MTFLADATATTVGGTHRAAHLEIRTSGSEVGAATMPLPAGLADAAVAWLTTHPQLLRGRSFDDIVDDLGSFTAEGTDLADRSPHDERSGARAAVALLTDALWDLWARSAAAPLWKLIVDLPPEHLVRSLDLRWVEDLLTPADAQQLLETRVRGRSSREADLRREGYPVVPLVPLSMPEALGRIEALAGAGWPALHVGVPDLSETERLVEVVAQARRSAGPQARLSVGPEWAWTPHVASAAVEALSASEGDVDTIVDPIDPHDVVGLAAIRKRLGRSSTRRIDLAAGGALGRPMSLKQLLASQAVDVCRFNPGRVGVTASLSLLLLAARLRTPVSFIAGGATPAGDGTAGLVTALHLAAVDDIAIGASLDRRSIDLGASPDLLAAALGGTAGRCRLPLGSGGPHRPDRPEGHGPDRPLSGSTHR